MALLERGELLERERVHAAELGELALGLREALLLLGADRTGPLGRRRALDARPGTGILGAVLGDQHVLDEAELGAGALEQARQVQLLLVDLHLEAVHVLGDRRAAARAGAASSRRSATSSSFCWRARPRPRRARAAPRPRSGRPTSSTAGSASTTAVADVHLPATDDGTPGRLLGGRALGLELARERVGARPARRAPARGRSRAAAAPRPRARGPPRARRAGRRAPRRRGSGAGCDCAVVELGRARSTAALSASATRLGGELRAPRRGARARRRPPRPAPARGRASRPAAASCASNSRSAARARRRLLLRDLQGAALLGEREPRRAR